MKQSCCTFLTLVLLTFFIFEGTQGAMAGHQAKQQSETEVVTNCVTAIGSHWSIGDVKKWADPSFAKLISGDGGRTEQTFNTVLEKLGPLKTINGLTPRSQESGRCLYQADMTCEKAPARVLLEMVDNGKGWKLRSINFDSRELAGAPVPVAVLKQFKQYVDTTIPKLGQKWSFQEFKAEADPIMLQHDEAHVRDQFVKMTGSVGPIVSYQKSEMAERGVKNGVPFATFRTMFNSPTGPALAVVVVTLRGNECKISGINMAKTADPAGSVPPYMALPPLQQPQATGSGVMPPFQQPAPIGSVAPAPAVMHDAQPALRPKMAPGQVPNQYNPTGAPNTIPDELPVTPSLTPELR